MYYRGRHWIQSWRQSWSYWLWRICCLFCCHRLLPAVGALCSQGALLHHGHYYLIENIWDWGRLQFSQVFFWCNWEYVLLHIKSFRELDRDPSSYDPQESTKQDVYFICEDVYYCVFPRNLFIPLYILYVSAVELQGLSRKNIFTVLYLGGCITYV